MESCKIFKVYQDFKGDYIRLNQNCISKAGFKQGDNFEFITENNKITLLKK